MALTARLLGRQFLGCHGLRPVFVSQCRSVSIQPRPAEAPCEEGHDEKNMRLCRPQSPFMTIFKWELPAILSINHRFTGMILSAYATTFAAASLLSSKPMGEVIDNISQCYPNFFFLFKAGLLLPFSYHFFNGIRHLTWDSGRFLTIKGVYITGYLMLLAAISSVAGLTFYINDLKKQELMAEEKRQQDEEEARAKEEKDREDREDREKGAKGKKCKPKKTK